MFTDIHAPTDEALRWPNTTAGEAGHPSAQAHARRVRESMQLLSHDTLNLVL